MGKKRKKTAEEERVEFEARIEKYKLRLERRQERLKRDIFEGVVRGKIIERTFNDGRKICIVRKWEPKGIQYWYDTKTLVQKVTERMDRWEAAHGKRICHINGRNQLQIRGKHLRRLLKAMPNVKQVGRTLIETV
jgi:hypothetical protein